LSIPRIVLYENRCDRLASLDNPLVCIYNVITLGYYKTIKNMGATIRTRIVKIGNSQGIRIPKLLLEQSGIHSEVEIEVQGDRITIRKAPRVRMTWDEAFSAMAKHHDDVLLDDANTTEWEQVEWEW
jgi:antitoxin MazE